jgi:tetratricopeptide (TPR) repeat protein
LPLPFVQILWANCQGLFALGPALVAAYAIGAGVWSRFGERPWYPFAPEGESPLPATGRFRRLAALFALCLAGSCVTPYGLRAFALPVKLLARLIPSEGNVFAANVAENVPPFAIERLLPGQFWHLKWFLGLLVLSVILSAGRMLLSHMLLVLGFVGLALIGNRNVLLLYWMATPIAAINLAPALRRALASFGRHRGLPLFRWASRSVVASLLLVVGTAAAREPPLSEPAPFRSPVESARVIESLPGQGTIFAADHHGGYLIWSLYPRYRPYIDTRLVLRSPEEFAEYLNLAADPERFDAFQRRHDFAYVVLPVGYPDRYLGLIAHLYGSRDWKLIFTDGAETLFAPRAAGDEDGWDLGAPATTDRVLARARKRFGASPRLFDRARIQLATLDTVVGKFREAERVLAEIHTPEAEALRARCRFASGDLQTAEEIGEQLLKADGNDVRSLDLLAMVHARRGELRHAAKLLRRALAVDPFDGEATSLLASMEEHRHENR